MSLEHKEFTSDERKLLAEKKEAMPDGSYPIRNRLDLQHAIQAYGRSKDREKTKRWIIRRAKELNLMDLLPEDWNSQNGSTEHMDYVTTFLEHYGTKGMKWGVRRAAKKAAKAEAKWEKKAYSRETAVKLYNSAATKANADLPGINQRWSGVDLTQPGRQRDQYHSEVITNFNSHLNDAASQYGVSPGGGRRLEATFDHTTGRLHVVATDVEHADLDNVVIKFEKDQLGHVTKFIVESNSLEQSDMVKDFLEHYGTKGMKWGVRRARTSRGGRTRYKDTSTKNLSDDEVQRRIRRMELEVRYNNLNKGQVSSGRDYATGILSNSGRAAAGAAVGTATSFLVARALKRKFGQ